MVVRIGKHLLEDDYRALALLKESEVVLDVGAMDNMSGEELTRLARLSFKNRIRYSARNANNSVTETFLLLNALYAFHVQSSEEQRVS